MAMAPVLFTFSVGDAPVLLDTVGRLDGFDYALMLRTLDFIEVHSEEKMTVVFQSGIRISVK